MDTESQFAHTAKKSRIMAGAMRACEKALADMATGRDRESLREPLRLLCLSARRENWPPEAVALTIDLYFASAKEG